MNKHILDQTQFLLELNAGAAPVAIRSLSQHLRELKHDQNEQQWNKTIESCRAHPLRHLIHQDPFTARAYNRPRGYQGDAELLDIIYNQDYQDVWRAGVTSLGRDLFNFNIKGKSPTAIRLRRDFLTRQIDSTCELNPTSRILSVACGHLREAQCSKAVSAKNFGCFVGLDQDQHSLDTVFESIGHLGVETVAGSIKTLLAGPLAAQRFDFIYAAGLYDHLDQRIAQRLTEKMFSMLEPGGRLLVANYLPDIHDVGYMEAYMGWRLIYRNIPEMQNLAEMIPSSQVATIDVYPDSTQTLVWLDIRAC